MIYSNSHKSFRIAASYDSRFDWMPLNTQQQIEESIIKHVILQVKPTSIIDLACGTGRILHSIEKITPEKSIELTGLDNSAQMLAVARRKLSRARLIRYDLGDSQNPRSGNADLITCFRFFSNAEPEFRNLALDFVLSNLSVGGYFLVNNHKNSSSITSRLLRLKHKQKEFGVRDSELFGKEMLENFKKIDFWSVGLAPQASESKYLIAPNLSKRIDLLAGRNVKWKVGTNNIYLFKKR